jgi:hypothetical protein
MREDQDNHISTRYFGYPNGLTAFFIIAYGAALAFPVIITLLAIVFQQGEQNFWILLARFASLVGLGSVWAILVGFAGWNFLVHRPVCVSDNGIATMMFGRPWHFIGWTDLESIVKQVTFEYERGGLVETLLFRKGRSKIRVRSYIGNYK